MMQKWIFLLVRLAKGLAGAGAGILLFVMLFDSISKKKELFEFVNPFGGRYLFPFFICLGVAIVFGVLDGLMKKRKH